MSPLIRRTVLTILAGLANLVQAAPLSFATALDLAERHSPRLAASTAMMAAARSAVVPAGTLPDPKVFAGIDNFPVSGPDAGRLQADFMTMQKIGVIQEVPNADKRHAREAVAAAGVGVAAAQQRVDHLSVRRETALAWLNLYYLQRKKALFIELDHENILLGQVVQAQIANGRAQVADALAPKQEAVQLADRRDDLARDEEQARSRLRQFIGVVADDGLSDDPPTFDIDAQHLRGHLHQHPELMAFAAETRKTEAEVAEAQSMKKSDWGVELAYQRRAPQFGNMVSIQFTFDLPVSPATRQDPLIAAKQRELDRIDAERDSMVRGHTAELESLLAEYATLTRQLERARQTALPLAEQKVSLQTASYQAGKSDLSAVLAARRERIEQRMRIVELEAGLTRTAARLHYAYGEDWQ
ncbi:TolC family protein [Undibacterium oligocarboniphilum]|uniref:TolC family protein n=1 Tax=Undibacterium oligocarboniphilum TaxID=666702 RepID=A0A850QAJ8_9BURK|nr:TolC family protein [Undibacterium oligocarboniphilum]MBC3868621.1 TolC family protein [Undibacterium oligocarboniphilum]NVO76601.1 TolC family protein [Undibacterium oligocarboniphilum]